MKNWNKKSGKKIDRKLATEMIDRYKKSNETNSVYFDMQMIESLTKIPGAAGVSVFFAADADNKKTVVLLPVNDAGKVIWNDTSEVTKALSAAGDTAVELGNTCPPYCPEV